MNVMFHILLMAIFPVVVAIWNLVMLRRLKLKKMHDRMLYRLCEVRDQAANLALEARISEESALFSFFYVKTATVVHVHDTQHMGLCFRSLIRAFDAAPSGKANANLIDELREPIPEIYLMAQAWCKAIEEGYEAAYPLIKLDRFGRIIRKFHLNVFKKIASLITPSPEEENIYNFSRRIRANIRIYEFGNSYHSSTNSVSAV
jgi:hypothetical protein